MSKNILIISASSNKNLELAKKFEEKLISLGTKTEILPLSELNLPLYSSLTESKVELKETLGPWPEKLRSTQAMVFLAPEYNGGIPPVMTNFLAWISRSSKDWRECFNGKAAVIGTHSGGGGTHALMAMRIQLGFIGMNVLGRQILTHSTKPLEEQALNQVCDQLIKYS